MARVVALVADLLFGSRVQATLSGAGHDVALVGDETRLRAELAQRSASGGSVLVVDLTDSALDGLALVRSLRAEGRLGRARTLGFYSHVDATMRTRADEAGFDLVVPRSRMAREGPSLVQRLASSS